MQVITLSPPLLDRACESMSEMVMDMLASAPDIVVGIQSGGAPIAESIAARIGIANIAYASATRPGSTVRSLMAPLLKRLPRGVNNVLRSAESRLLRHTPGGDRKVAFSISGEMVAMIATAKAPVLLVVDDAVDSGKTLSEVVTRLKSMYPHARVVTAAVAVTTPDPVFRPDISLYADTLVRFPWSADYSSPAEAD